MTKRLLLSLIASLIVPMSHPAQAAPEEIIYHGDMWNMSAGKSSMLIMRLKVDGDDISGELEMTRPRPFKGPVTGKRSGRNCQLQTRLTDGSLMQLNGNCWSEGFNGSLLVRFEDDRMPQKGHFNSGRLGAGQREEDD